MSEAIFEAVVLAAGKGTRMRSAVSKPLSLIDGKPAVARVLNTLIQLHLSRVHIVIYDEDVKEYIVSHYPEETSGNEPRFSFCWQKKQKGTAHAVFCVLPYIGENSILLVTYSDIPLIFPNTYSRLLDFPKINQGEGFAFLTQYSSNPYGYGRVIRDVHRNAIRIVEHKHLTKSYENVQEINVGIMVAHKDIWKKTLEFIKFSLKKYGRKEFYLTDCIENATNLGILVFTQFSKCEEECLGFNTKLQLHRIERIFLRRKCEDLLDQGVWVSDIMRLDVRGDNVKIADDVRIDVDVVLKGNTIIEKGASIGSHCVISNCHIGRGAVIHDFSHLQDATVGAESNIGPYARLRPGASIGSEARIGNFVEIKKSEVGDCAKISHLSYIGDSQVGKKVNIGAGVIICNYDGVSKYKTTIEDGAFIGSGCELIAPIHIGENAYLAAGSTVTRDVKADALTIVRERKVVTRLRRKKGSNS